MAQSISFQKLILLTSKVILSAIILFISICTVVSLPTLLVHESILGFYPKEFISIFIYTCKELLTLGDATLVLHSGSVPFFTYILKPYTYSMTILFSALILTILLGFFATYFYLILPQKIKKFFLGIISLTETLPDILIISSFQFFIIIFLKKTGIKIVQIYGIQSDPYVLPILCLSIVPLFMLIRMMITILEEEFQKTYVDLVKAKGLSTIEVFFRHILRNIMYSLSQQLNTIYWFMLTSLIIIEYSFALNGFTFTLYRSMQPEILAIGILLLLLPYGLLYLFIQLIDRLVTGRGVL